MSSAASIKSPAGLMASHPTSRRRRNARLAILASVLLLIGAAFMAVVTGPSNIPTGTILAALSGQADALSVRDAIILYDVRLPRVALGALVGAALAVTGAMLQGLFRNPLADPGIVGVSSGAAVAAVAAIVLGEGPLVGVALLLGHSFLPLMAFAGALLTTSLLYLLATRAGRTSIATLLLAGLAIAAIGNAITGLVIFMADDQQLRDITFWTLGSLGGATWDRVSAILPFIAFLIATLPFVARGLDALALGESEAMHLGIGVETLKRVVILAVAAACGAAVAVSGIIGFVGIVVPHLLRLVMGPSNGPLLAASAFGGAALLVAADTVCRTIAAPAELPIGIVTALIGAPVFMSLLLRRRRLADY